MAEGSIDLLQQIHSRIISKDGDRTDSAGQAVRRDDGISRPRLGQAESREGAAGRGPHAGTPAEEESRAQQADRVSLGSSEKGRGSEVSDALQHSPRSQSSGYLGRMFRLWDLLLKEWSNFSGLEPDEPSYGRDDEQRDWRTDAGYTGNTDDRSGRSAVQRHIGTVRRQRDTDSEMSSYRTQFLAGSEDGTESADYEGQVRLLKKSRADAMRPGAGPGRQAGGADRGLPGSYDNQAGVYGQASPGVSERGQGAGPVSRKPGSALYQKTYNRIRNVPSLKERGEEGGYREEPVSHRVPVAADPIAPLSGGSFVFEALRDRQEPSIPEMPEQAEPAESEKPSDPLSFIDDFSPGERARLEKLVQCLTDEQLHVMVDWMARPVPADSGKNPVDGSDALLFRKDLLSGLEGLNAVADPSIALHAYAMIHEAGGLERAPFTAKLSDSLQGQSCETQQHLAGFLMELAPGERNEILDVTSAYEVSAGTAGTKRLIESLASLSDRGLESTLSFMRNSECYREGGSGRKADALRLAVMAQGIEGEDGKAGSAGEPDPEGIAGSFFALTDGNERDRRQLLARLESSKPGAVKDVVGFITDPDGMSAGREPFSRNPEERREEVLSEAYGRLAIQNATGSGENRALPENGEPQPLTSYFADITRKMRNRISPRFVNSTLRQLSSLKVEDGGRPRYDVDTRELTLPGSFARNPESVSQKEGAQIVHELFHAAFWAAISPGEAVSKGTMAFASKVTDLYRRTEESAQTKERFHNALGARYRDLGFGDREIDLIKSKASHNVGELISHVATLIMARDDKGRSGIEATDPRGKKYLLEGLPPGSITLVHEWMADRQADAADSLSEMTGQQLQNLKNRFVKASDIFKRSRGADAEAGQPAGTAYSPAADKGSRQAGTADTLPARRATLSADMAGAAPAKADLHPGMASAREIGERERPSDNVPVKAGDSLGQPARAMNRHEDNQALPEAEPQPAEGGASSPSGMKEEGQAVEAHFDIFENAFSGMLAKEKKRFEKVINWLNADEHREFFTLFEGAGMPVRKDMFRSFTESISGLKSKDQKDLVRLISSSSLLPSDRKEILAVTAGLRNTRKNPDRSQFIERCSLLSQKQLSDISEYMSVSPLYREQKSPEDRADFIKCAPLVQSDCRELNSTEVGSRDQLLGSFFDTSPQGSQDRKTLIDLMTRSAQQCKDQTLGFFADPEGETFGSVPPASSADIRRREILTEAYLRLRMGEAEIEGGGRVPSSQTAPLIGELVDVTRLSRDDVSPDFLLSAARTTERISFQPVMTPSYDASGRTMTLPSRYLEQDLKADTESPASGAGAARPEMVKAFIDPSIRENLKDTMFSQYRTMQISQEGIKRLNSAWRWCTENLRNGGGSEGSAVNAGDGEAQITSQVASVLMQLNSAGYSATKAESGSAASSSMENVAGRLNEAKNWMLSALPGDMVRFIRDGSLNREAGSFVPSAGAQGSAEELRSGMMRAHQGSISAVQEESQPRVNAESAGSNEPVDNVNRHDSVVRLRGRRKNEGRSGLLKDEPPPTIGQSTSRLLNRISAGPAHEKPAPSTTAASESLRTPAQAPLPAQAPEALRTPAQAPLPAQAAEELRTPAQAPPAAQTVEPSLLKPSPSDKAAERPAPSAASEKHGLSSSKWYDALSEADRNAVIGLADGLAGKDRDRFVRNIESLSADAVSASLAFTRQSSFYRDISIPGERTDAFLLASALSGSDAGKSLSQERKDELVKSALDLTFSSTLDRNNIVGMMVGGRPDVAMKTMEFMSSPAEKTDCRSGYAEKAEDRKREITAESYVKLQLGNALSGSDGSPAKMSDKQKDELTGRIVNLFRGRKETVSTQFVLNCLREIKSINVKDGTETSFDVKSRELRISSDFLTNMDGMSGKEKSRVVHEMMHVAFRATLDKEQTSSDTSFAFVSKVTDLHRQIQEDSDVRGRFMTGLEGFYNKLGYDAAEIERIKKSCLTSAEDLTAHMGFMVMADKMAGEKKQQSGQAGKTEDDKAAKERQTLAGPQPQRADKAAKEAPAPSLGAMLPKGAGEFFSSWIGGKLTADDELTSQVARKVSQKLPLDMIGTSILGTGVTSMLSFIVKKGAEAVGALAASSSSPAAPSASGDGKASSTGSPAPTGTATAAAKPSASTGTSSAGADIRPAASTGAASTGAAPAGAAGASAGSSGTAPTSDDRESAGRYLSRMIEKARSTWDYSVDSYQDASWYKGLNEDQQAVASSLKSDMGLYGMKDLDERLKGMDAETVSNFFTIVGKEEDKNKYRSKLAWRLTTMTGNMKPDEAKSAMASLSKLDNEDVKNFDMTFNSVLNSRARKGVQDEDRVKVAAQFTTQLSRMTPEQQKELLSVTGRLPSETKTKFLEMFGSMKPEEMQSLGSYMEGSEYYRSLGKGKEEDLASRKATALMLAATISDSRATGTGGGNKAELDKVDSLVKNNMSVFTQDSENFKKYGMDFLRRLKSSESPDNARKTLECLGRNVNVTDSSSQRRAIAFAGLHLSLLDSGVKSGEAENTTWGLMSNYFDNQPNNSIESILKTKKIEFREGDKVGPSFDTKTGVMVLPSVMKTRIEGFDRLVASHESDHAAQAGIGDKDNPESNNFMAVLMGTPQDLYRDYKNSPEKMNNALIAYYQKMAESDTGDKAKAGEKVKLLTDNLKGSDGKNSVVMSFDELNAHLRTITKQSENGQSDTEKTAAQQAMSDLGLDDRQKNFYSKWVNGNLPNNSAVLEALARSRYHKPVADYTKASGSLYEYLSKPENSKDFDRFKNTAASRLKDMGFSEGQINEKLKCADASGFALLYNEVMFNKDRKGVTGAQSESFLSAVKGISQDVSTSVDSINTVVKDGFGSKYDSAFSYIRERGRIDRDVRLIQDYGISQENIKAFCDKSGMKYEDFDGQIGKLNDVMVQRHKASAHIRTSEDKEGAFDGYTDAKDDVSAAASGIMNNMLAAYNKEGVKDNWVTQGQCNFSGKDQGHGWWFPLGGGGTKPVNNTGQGGTQSPGTQIPGNQTGTQVNPQTGTQTPEKPGPDIQIPDKPRIDDQNPVKPPYGNQTGVDPQPDGKIKVPAGSGTPTVYPSTVPTSTVPTSTVPTSTVPTSTVPTSTVPTSTVPTSTVPTTTGTNTTTVIPVNNQVITNPSGNTGAVTKPAAQDTQTPQVSTDESQLSKEAKEAAQEEKANKEAETKKKADEEAAKKADEAKKLQEEIQKKEAEAKKLEEESKRKTEEAKKHEEDLKAREAEAVKAREEQQKKSAEEAETRKSSEEAKAREAEQKKGEEKKAVESETAKKEEEAKKQYSVKKESEPKKDEVIKLKNEAESLKGQADTLKKEATTQKEDLFNLLEQMDRLHGKHKQVADEILKDLKPHLGDTASEVASSLSDMIEAGAFTSHNAKENLKTFLSLLGRSDGPEHAAEFLARSSSNLNTSNNLVKFLQAASKDPEGGALTARFIEVSTSTQEGCTSLARIMQNLSMGGEEMKDFLGVLNMAHAQPEGAESLARSFTNMVRVPGGAESLSAFIANASSTGQNAKMLSQVLASMAGTREGAQQMANLLGKLTTMSPESQESLLHSFRQMTSTQEGAHFLSQAVASTALDSGGAKVMAGMLQGAVQSGEGMQNLLRSMKNMSSSAEGATNTALFMERASSSREGAEALVKTFERFTRSGSGTDTSSMAGAFCSASYTEEGSLALAKAFRNLSRANEGAEIFSLFMKSGSSTQEGGTQMSRMFAQISAAPEGSKFLADLLVKLSTASRSSQESLLESFSNMSTSAEGARNLGRAMAGVSTAPEGARAASRLIQMASSTDGGCNTLFGALKNMTSSADGAQAAAQFMKSAASDSAGAESLGRAFSNLTASQSGARDMLSFFARVTAGSEGATLLSSALNSMAGTKGNEDHLLSFISGASNGEREGRALSTILSRLSSTQEGAANLNKMISRLTSGEEQRQTLVDSFAKLSGTREGARLLGSSFTAMMTQPQGDAALGKMLQSAVRSGEGTSLFLRAFSEGAEKTGSGSSAFISLLSKAGTPAELSTFLTHTASSGDHIESFSKLLKDASREEGNTGKIGQLMQKASSTAEGSSALVRIISKEMQSTDGAFRVTSLLNGISQSNDGALPLARVLQNISSTSEGRETLSQFMHQATKSQEGSHDVSQMLASISFSKEGARALSDILSRLSSHSPEVRQNLMQSFTRMAESEEGAEFLGHAMAHTSSVKEGAGVMATLIEAASKTPSGVTSLFQSIRNMSASADGSRNMSMFIGKGTSSEEGSRALTQALGSMASTSQGAADMASILSNASGSIEGSTVLSRSMLNMADSKGGAEVVLAFMKSAASSERGAFDLATAMKQMASTSEGALDLSKLIVQLSRSPKGSGELLQAFSKLISQHESSQMMTSAFTNMAATPSGLRNLSHFVTQSLSSPDNARQLLSFFGEMSPTSEGARGMMLSALTGKSEGARHASTLLAMSSHSPELQSEFVSFLAGAARDGESSGRIAQFLQAGSSSREGIWSTLKLMDSIASQPESLGSFTKTLASASASQEGGLSMAKVMSSLGSVSEGLEQLTEYFVSASKSPAGGKDLGQLFSNMAGTAEGSKIFADMMQKASSHSTAVQENMVRTFQNITSGTEGAEYLGKAMAGLSGSTQGMKSMLEFISDVTASPGGSSALLSSFRSMTSTLDGAGSMAVFFEHAAFSAEGAKTVGDLFRKSLSEAGGAQDMASFMAKATSGKDGTMLLTRTLLNLSAMNEYADLLPSIINSASKGDESRHSLALMLSNMAAVKENREGLSRLLGGIAGTDEGGRSLLGSLAGISSSREDVKLLSRALLNMSQTPEGERALTRMIQSSSRDAGSSESLYSLVRNLSSTPEGSTCAALLLQKGAQAYEGSSALAKMLGDISASPEKAQDVASMLSRLSSTADGAVSLSRSMLAMTGSEGRQTLMGNFVEKFSQSPRALMDFGKSLLNMTSTSEGAHNMSLVMKDIVATPQGLTAMQRFCEGLSSSPEGSAMLGATFSQMSSTSQGKAALSDFMLQTSSTHDGTSILSGMLSRVAESPGGASSLSSLFERISTSKEGSGNLASTLGALSTGKDGIRMVSRLLVRCSETEEGGAMLARTVANLGDTKNGSENLARLMRNASSGRETGAMLAKGMAQMTAGDEGVSHLTRFLAKMPESSGHELFTVGTFAAIAQSDEGAVSLSRALLNMTLTEEGSQNLGSMLTRMTSGRDGASSLMALLPSLQATPDGAKNLAHFFLRSASSEPGRDALAGLMANVCGSGEGAREFIRMMGADRGGPVASKAYAATFAELSTAPRGREAIASTLRNAIAAPDGAVEFTKSMAAISYTPDGSISLARFLSGFTADSEKAALLNETFLQAAGTGEGVKELARLAEHASSTPEGARELAKALDHLAAGEKGSGNLAGLLGRLSSSEDGVKGLGRTLVNLSYSPESSRDIMAVLQRCCSSAEGSSQVADMMRHLAASRDGAESVALFLKGNSSAKESGCDSMPGLLNTLATSKRGADSITMLLDRISSSEFGVKSLSATVARMTETGEGAAATSALFEKLTSSSEGAVCFGRLLDAVSGREERTGWAGVLVEMSRDTGNIGSLSRFISNMNITDESRSSLVDFFAKAALEYDGARSCAKIFDQASTNPELKDQLESLLSRVSESKDGSGKVARLLEGLDRGRREQVLTGTRSSESAAVLRGDEALSKLRSDIDVSIFQRPVLARSGAELELEGRFIMAQGMEADTRKAEQGLERALTQMSPAEKALSTSTLGERGMAFRQIATGVPYDPAALAAAGSGAQSGSASAESNAAEISGIDIVSKADDDEPEPVKASGGEEKKAETKRNLPFRPIDIYPESILRYFSICMECGNKCASRQVLCARCEAAYERKIHMLSGVSVSRAGHYFSTQADVIEVSPVISDAFSREDMMPGEVLSLRVPQKFPKYGEFLALAHAQAGR
jgi:hypothetical protein